MNFNLLGIVTFASGVVLLYAGIKNVDPRDVVKNALKGQSPTKNVSQIPKRDPMGINQAPGFYTLPTYENRSGF